MSINENKNRMDLGLFKTKGAKCVSEHCVKFWLKEIRKTCLEELLKMLEYVLKNNCFKFGNKIKQQISKTAISTKFAPPKCIFSGAILKLNLGQYLKSLGWLLYINDIFFIWTHREESLQKFLEEVNDFKQSIKFTYKYSAENIPFLDLKVVLKDRKISNIQVKPTGHFQYLHFSLAHPN